MNTPNTFSLSLQKQIDHERIVTDSELNRTFIELRFSTLIKKRETGDRPRFLRKATSGNFSPGDSRLNIEISKMPGRRVPPVKLKGRRKSHKRGLPPIFSKHMQLTLVPCLLFMHCGKKEKPLSHDDPNPVV